VPPRGAIAGCREAARVAVAADPDIRSSTKRRSRVSRFRPGWRRSGDERGHADRDKQARYLGSELGGITGRWVCREPLRVLLVHSGEVGRGGNPRTPLTTSMPFQAARELKAGHRLSPERYVPRPTQSARRLGGTSCLSRISTYLALERRWFWGIVGRAASLTPNVGGQ
jgi:hypothetical protein